MMIPPVGKSGPGIAFIKSATVASLFLIKMCKASITSFKLCDGMLVVIPTAIPVAPLTKRLGNLAGKTVGSFSSPS